MFDRMFYWRRDRVRYQLLVRAWRVGLRWWLLGLRGWLSGNKWQRPSFWWRHLRSNNPECYCPEGSSTGVHLECFGVGFWVELGRAWTVWPCHCDKVIWLLFPEDHEEDIEDYGRERLQAEYPNLRPYGSST